MQVSRTTNLVGTRGTQIGPDPDRTDLVSVVPFPRGSGPMDPVRRKGAMLNILVGRHPTAARQQDVGTSP